MSREKLDSWLKRDDSELVSSIVQELTAHLATIETDQLTGYAVQVLDGANHRGEYLTVAWTTVQADDTYMKYCAYEWEDTSEEALSKSQAMLLERHKTFESLHTKDPSDYMMDDDEVANLAQLETCVLTALKKLRGEEAFPKSAFAVVWCPQSPTDLTPLSVKELNSKAVTKEYLTEFDD